MKTIITALLLGIALSTTADGTLGTAAEGALSATAEGTLRQEGCRHMSSRTAAAAAARRAAARRGLYQGERRQLVLLASFNDLTFKADEPQQLWNRIFNEEHFSEEPFVGSVHDYFYDQSYGLFNLHFDLHHVALDQPHSRYRSGYINGNVADDTGAGLLLCDLLDAVKETIDDWNVYDWDNDGRIDQVFILFAGRGQNAGGGSTTIWPHQWVLSEQGEEPFLREWGQPYRIEANGAEYVVDNYACFAELSQKSDYGSFGTLCHEYGHCLGLPDFYYGAASSVVGAWDIMDSGIYNQGGFCPPGYSAHERMVLGWTDVKELTEPSTVSAMAPLSEGGEAYLIRNDGYTQEYYIVENRRQQGWDQSLPGSGLVVFHIDYDEEEWLTGVPNSREYKRYSIIPANGQTSLARNSQWPYPYSDGAAVNDRLTNTSQPKSVLFHANTDGSMLMNKPLTQINVDASGMASFCFMGGSDGISPATATAGATEMLYRVGDIYIIRYANGTVKKVRRP